MFVNFTFLCRKVLVFLKVAIGEIIKIRFYEIWLHSCLQTLNTIFLFVASPSLPPPHTNEIIKKRTKLNGLTSLNPHKKAAFLFSTLKSWSTFIVKKPLKCQCCVFFFLTIIDVLNYFYFLRVRCFLFGPMKNTLKKLPPR